MVMRPGLDLRRDEETECRVRRKELDDKAYEGSQELATTVTEGFPDTAHGLNNLRAAAECSGSFFSFLGIPGFEPDQLSVQLYPPGFVPRGQELDGVLACVSGIRRKPVRNFRLFFFSRFLAAGADLIGQHPFVFHV